MTFQPIQITVAEVRAFFPNFTGINPTDMQITTALSIAVNTFGADCLDDNGQRIAFMFLVAHYISKQSKILNSSNPSDIGGDGSNPVASFSVGSYSESKSIPQDITDNPILADFSTTAYGRQYLNLAYICHIGNIAVVGGGTTP